MDFEKYHMYAVEGDAALAKRETYRELTKQRAANAQAWAEKHGGRSPLNRGQFLCGIITPKGEKPSGPGWSIDKHQPNEAETWWTYNFRTKAGMAIEREVNSNDLRQGTSEGLASAITGLIGGCFIDAGSFLRSSQAWDENGHVFLIVPKREGKPAPDIDGCRPLKLSEFYAMKEETALAANESSVKP